MYTFTKDPQATVLSPDKWANTAHKVGGLQVGSGLGAW